MEISPHDQLGTVDLNPIKALKESIASRPPIAAHSLVAAASSDASIMLVASDCCFAVSALPLCWDSYSMSARMSILTMDAVRSW